MHQPSPIRFEASATQGQAIASAAAPDIGWRQALPRLRANGATVRELCRSDASSLLRTLSSEEVTRFISPPPTTIEGFERFIEWTHRERQTGGQIVFGILPTGCEEAKGLIQVRQLCPGFLVAEWGFALASSFWGTGVFMDSARLVLDFAFTELGVHRLEARAAVDNGRGNGVLRKLGAQPDGTLRQSLPRHGAYVDQILWSILKPDRVHGLDSDDQPGLDAPPSAGGHVH